MNKKQFRKFESARIYVQNLKLKSVREWNAFCSSGKKPKDIPTDVRHVYKNYWDGWRDWLGYEKITWLPFTESRKIIRNLELETWKEWGEYCKSGKKPHNIPVNPHQVYSKDWEGMTDWLGNAYLPFLKARDEARKTCGANRIES